MELLFENEYIQINLDSKHECIEYNWKRSPSNQQFISLMDKIYRYIVKFGCTKLLPDLRNQNTLTDKVRSWTRVEWFPNVIHKGVRTCAIVKRNSDRPNDSIDSLYGNIPLPTNKLNVTLAYFNNIETARAWISSV
jgi:hypothetical protein